MWVFRPNININKFLISNKASPSATLFYPPHFNRTFNRWSENPLWLWLMRINIGHRLQLKTNENENLWLHFIQLILTQLSDDQLTLVWPQQSSPQFTEWAISGTVGEPALTITKNETICCRVFTPDVPRNQPGTVNKTGRSHLSLDTFIFQHKRY